MRLENKVEKKIEVEKRNYDGEKIYLDGKKRSFEYKRE